MALLKSFSELFDVSKSDVERLGFFDITPAVDSALYIDAQLLNDNISPYFKNASSILKRELSKIVAVISKIKDEDQNDVFYKSADKALKFKEIQGTCLGYSQQSTYGKGIGPTIRKDIISNIKQITSKGFLEPEIMELLCVFTDGFGCDLSSDLITFLLKNVILDYNVRIIEELKLQSHKRIKYLGKQVLENPFRPKTPLLLLPKCILSDLPICCTFEDISYAYQQNEEARKNLQSYIDVNGVLEKKKVFEILMSDNNFIQVLLDSYKGKSGNKYDFETDPLCVWKFRDIIENATNNNPSIFHITSSFNKAKVKEVAIECLNVYKHLIEDCGGRNQIQKFNEKGLQFLFFASSYVACMTNGVDLCPEVNHGRGPIDFYLTNGIEKISIEMKKSTNSQYKHGLNVQLPAYMESNGSAYGYYVFMNYDVETSKRIEALYKVYNSLDSSIKKSIEVVVIQSSKLESASKESQ